MLYLNALLFADKEAEVKTQWTKPKTFVSWLTGIVMKVSD